MKHVHIIGAGLAGLSAAVALTQAGRRVTLYEAGPAAGGRCRSYFDRALGVRIGNGNHLLLSGNDCAMEFLWTIGAVGTMIGPGRAVFPFMDLRTGERWMVEPGAGRIPWWLFTRRIPGTRLAEYLSILKLRRKGATVAEAIGHGALAEKLLEPLAVSGLNTQTDTALASLMWAVVAGSLLRGGSACVPLVPREGLSESFIDPAIAWIEARGGTLHTSSRVSALQIEGQRISALALPSGPVSVGADEAVVLAVPPWIAADLLPTLPVPTAFEAIINIHFRVEMEPNAAPIVGLIGGTAEWIFVKSGIVSVTISAANRLLDVSTEEIAALVWSDVKAALRLAGDMPAVRVVREKRATFAATAANEALRPGPRTSLHHFAVAGDWTATGLPATIEGAIRSGNAAAGALLSA